MKIAGQVLLAALFGGVVIFALNFLSYDNSQNKFLRPWQVAVDNQGGSEVFGLKFGQSNVQEALKLFSDSEQFLLTMQFALIKNKNQSGKIKLEAYFEKINLSGIAGKLVLVFTANGDFNEILSWRNQPKKNLNLKESFVNIQQVNLAELAFLRLSNITLVPNQSLSEEKLLSTFGQADEKIKMSDEISHFLYPNIGVDVVVNRKAKDVIQYVAPKDFNQIRAPLLQE